MDLPYDYYQFIRFLALIGFSILAYLSSIKKNQIMVFIFGALALLFQPFLKISIGRDLWNIVDIVTGLFLIISLFLTEKNTQKKIIKNDGKDILKK